MSYNPSLEDRQSQVSEAKKALLEKFKKSLDPNDPAKVAKQQERAAISAARAQRAAQREKARIEHEKEMARQAAIRAAEEAEARRVAAEQAARDAAEQAERDVVLKAEQKAARDARYAARKAAKRRRKRGL